MMPHCLTLLFYSIANSGCVFIAVRSSLFITKFVVSMNLSTQLYRQDSVRDSRRADGLSIQVSQQMSVRS